MASLFCSMKFITRNILLLSLVSLFTDMSSEFLFPILPIYLQQIGFSGTLIGLLEGISEIVASYGKGVFGSLSDRMGQRKSFVFSGYGLSAVSKLLMGLWSIGIVVFISRVFDRAGKGIRSSARDALLSDESSTQNRAKVFGFHRSMDTLGAVIGPAMALVLITQTESLKDMFLWASIPAFLSLVFILFVKEVKHEKKVQPVIHPFKYFKYWKFSDPAYKKLIRLFIIYAIVNSSDLFLILYMKKLFGIEIAIINYIIYNITYTLFSYPAGIIADKIGFKLPLIFGAICFSVTYLGISLMATEEIHYYILFSVYGLYAAFSEGNTRAWISNVCKKEERATAFGFYSSIVGIAQLLSGLIAGIIWDYYTGEVLFLYSGIGVAVCGMFFIIYLPKKNVYET